MEWVRKDGRIIRPHVYKLDESTPTAKLDIWKDKQGWLWIQVGRYQFTTHA